ncbi:MAG TPA: TlpA disulfide reductase family protein [Terriglobales bacterium]|nr:TlpA disulfide reductase family protein [Terriglobales bacterium]
MIRPRQSRRLVAVSDRRRADVKVPVACLLIAVCWVPLCCPGHAQSSVPDATTPEKKDQPQSKAKRVWDEEEIRKLKGGVSVVGNPSSRQPASAKAGNITKPVAAVLPARRPGLSFKATTLDGDELTSDSLQGKTVLVQFWTTWCPHCRKDQSPVDGITRDFEDKGLVVIAVDVDEPRNTVTKYLKQSPRSCRIVLAKDTDLAALFPPSSFPTYVLIDRDGNFVGTKKGEAGEEGLRHLLDRAKIDSD